MRLSSFCFLFSFVAGLLAFIILSTNKRSCVVTAAAAAASAAVAILDHGEQGTVFTPEQFNMMLRGGKENASGGRTVAAYQDTSLSRAERLKAFKALKARKNKTAASAATRRVSLGEKTNSSNVGSLNNSKKKKKKKSVGTGTRRASTGRESPLATTTVSVAAAAAAATSPAPSSSLVAANTVGPTTATGGFRKRPGTVEKLKKKMAHFASLFDDSRTPGGPGTKSHSVRRTTTTALDNNEGSGVDATTEAEPDRRSTIDRLAPSSAQKAMRSAQKDLDLQLSVGKNRRMQMLDRMRLRQSQRKDQQTRARTARQFQRDLELSRSVQQEKAAGRLQERCNAFVTALDSACDMAKQHGAENHKRALAKFAAVAQDDYYNDARCKAAYWVAQARFHAILGDAAAVESLLGNGMSSVKTAGDASELAILKKNFEMILEKLANSKVKDAEAKAIAAANEAAAANAVSTESNNHKDMRRESSAMPVKQLNFMEDGDSLPAIHDAEDEEEDSEDKQGEDEDKTEEQDNSETGFEGPSAGIAAQPDALKNTGPTKIIQRDASHATSVPNSPAIFARKIGGGALREPVPSPIQPKQSSTARQMMINTSLGGGARRLSLRRGSRRVSTGPTIDNVSLFDENEDSVLNSTNYTGYTDEEDEEDFPVEDLVDTLSTGAGVFGPRNDATLTIVAEHGKGTKASTDSPASQLAADTAMRDANTDCEDAIIEQNEENESAFTLNTVDADSAAAAAAHEEREARIRERLKEIPPAYVLVQEQMRCTPSQKKRFQSNSYVSVVRRSLRKEKAVQSRKGADVAKMLSESNWSYIPNNALVRSVTTCPLEYHTLHA